MMRTKELPDIYILSDDSRMLKLDTNLFISSDHPFLMYLKEQINLCVQKKNVEVQNGFRILCLVILIKVFMDQLIFMEQTIF